MQVEVLILLVALFGGPTNDMGEVYVFENPTFSDKESCKQYARDNQDWLHVYLSDQWKTLPDIYASLLLCMSRDEIKKFFRPATKENLSI